jgi:hypothetical protein
MKRNRVVINKRKKIAGKYNYNTTRPKARGKKAKIKVNRPSDQKVSKNKVVNQKKFKNFSSFSKSQANISLIKSNKLIRSNRHLVKPKKILKPGNDITPIPRRKHLQNFLKISD